MPEGDAIFRTASVLRRALVGGVIRRAFAQPRPGLARVPPLERLIGSSSIAPVACSPPIRAEAVA